MARERIPIQYLSNKGTSGVLFASYRTAARKIGRKYFSWGKMRTYEEALSLANEFLVTIPVELPPPAIDKNTTDHTERTARGKVYNERREIKQNGVVRRENVLGCASLALLEFTKSTGERVPIHVMHSNIFGSVELFDPRTLTISRRREFLEQMIAANVTHVEMMHLLKISRFKLNTELEKLINPKHKTSKNAPMTL